MERRGEPLNISNNTTDLVNNVTQTSTPEASKIAQQSTQNLTRNDVCIQNHPNETNCYLFGKYEYPAS